ncbi:MAG TPA: hypothetical protein VHD83_13730 [Puia sp.]|nr:hypothetical protein [Puia sp.]
MKKFLLIATVVLVVGLGIFIYFYYYRSFGEGTKFGELNYVVKKGWIFKTYEGKLIQAGIRSKTPGSVQSYEFEFSVTDTAIANKLMYNSGKSVLLHYQEYGGKIPWRGYSNFIVDSIVSITEPER